MGCDGVGGRRKSQGQNNAVIIALACLVSPLTEMKLALHWLATALAKRVFPQPGGP